MAFFRINSKCNGCLACVQNCPAGALDYLDKGDKRQLFHSMTRCARCGQCWRICPQEAIEFQHLMKGDWDEVATMDLVRCSVCGEPLYTMDFSQTLTDKLNYKIEPLCPKHRQSLSMIVWKHMIPHRTGAEERDK